MRLFFKIALPVVLFLAAAGIYILLLWSKPEVVIRTPQERAWPVSVIAVTYGDHQPRLSVFGSIVAGRSVEMRALVAGSVVAVGPGLREGGVVKAGDLLLAVDDFDFTAGLAEAEAQLKEAQAKLRELIARRESEQLSLKTEQTQLELRQKDLERQQELRARGTVSEKAVDDAQLAITQVQQAVAARRQSVAAAIAAVEQQQATRDRLDVMVQRAQRDLERTQLTAPFDGVVSNVGAELGKRVNQNDRIAEITDPYDLEARFQLSNQQYGRLLSATGKLEGQTVSVIWSVGDRKLSYIGAIERVAAEIDATRGGVAVFAQLQSDGLETPLRPGAFVEVEMKDRQYTNVALIPDNALFTDGVIYEVVDVDGVSRLKQHVVEVLARTPDGILIQGDVANGAQIVTTRFAEIGPGVQVRTMTEQEISS